MDKSIKHQNLDQNKDENSFMKTFTKGIFKENSIFVMALGLTPALAITSSFEGAFGMGMLVFIVLTLTNIIVSLLRNLIPNEIKMVVYLIVIATEVTILKMFIDAFLPALASKLGIFVALITVNMIILSRAETVASKNKVIPSILDGLGVSLGFLLSLSIIGFLRELIGTGKIVLGQILPLGFEVSLFDALGLSKYALDVFVQPPGAFFIVGLLFALFVSIKQKKEAK
jgi:Na+-translocating ferredoxin:NAD+ oxidoreductase subunit E